MANSTSNVTPANLRKLQWQNQCGFEVANDGRCLYMRETAGSIIAGFIFGTFLCVALLVSGGMMVAQNTTDGKIFGGFVMLLGLFFGFLTVTTARRGRWMIVYDRGTGEPGAVGEIRFRGQRLTVNHVRCITTQSTGGNPPRRTVSAELHDGTYRSLGPIGMSTWPGHWAKQAADWMGLPYRDSWG